MIATVAAGVGIAMARDLAHRVDGGVTGAARPGLRPALFEGTER